MDNTNLFTIFKFPEKNPTCQIMIDEVELPTQSTSHLNIMVAKPFHSMRIQGPNCVLFSDFEDFSEESTIGSSRCETQ
jgi:hypothetical protein